MKFVILTLALISLSAFAAEVEENKDLKNIQFESLLIQGQIQRPDISIVTGDPGNDLDGLLRLRQDFSDLMAMDSGEVIQ
ncbi:MAG: hypothetical protein K2P81_12945 [Bacteriovoracaceae bacterium]|nr:hypothetical protein [Bacteriovoracaceae bacterium]